MLKAIKEKCEKLCAKACLAVANFRANQEGDTNFVSIMIILGIVVVFAGLFLTLGKGVITNIQTSINNFINGLGK